MFQLLLLFTVIPVVEIWLLAQLSNYLGIVDTVLLVLATGMVGALEKAKRDVPNWLRLLAEEEVAKSAGVDTAIFGMA